MRRLSARPWEERTRMNEKGTATLICSVGGHETDGVVGELGTEETDVGRLFYPDQPFACPECGDDAFEWLEFWDEG